MTSAPRPATAASTFSLLWLEQFGQDVSFAFRTLAKSKGFTTVAILTLALGIGATTTIFSVVNALILRPLQYDSPGQLVQVWEKPATRESNWVSPGILTDWRTHATLFEGFAGYTNAARNLTGVGEPVRVTGLRMSANGLHLLRAKPILGRIFAPDEDQAGKDKVIVLTHQFWQRQFGGATDIVGRTIALNGQGFTVIGVLAAGFLPYEQQLFVIPLVLTDAQKQNRGGHFLQVTARLKPGVSLAQGQAELVALANHSRALYPEWKKDWTAALVPLNEQLVSNLRPALLILLGAVGFVLAIACANVANLLLARAASREKEIALRLALGAGRGRIIRQLLAESVVLSVGGGVLGLAVSFWAIRGLRQLIGAMNFARANEIALDANVLGIAFLIAVGTGICFGLVPAIQASRPELTGALKDAARGSGARGDRLRSGLIAAEVALSLVLLVGSVLLLTSFYRLLNVPPGFNPDSALTLQLSIPDSRYPDNAKRVEFFNRVADRVATLPGVVAAGFVDYMPLAGGQSDRFVRIPGWVGDKEPGFDADNSACTPDWFRAMGVPLKLGRFFDARDLAPDRRVAIINEAMVRACFPDGSPLGRTLVYDNLAWEIVGVIGDVRARGLNRDAQPIVYRPVPQDSWNGGTLVVRTTVTPMALAETVRKAILEIDSEQPVANIRPLADVVAGSMSDRRLTVTLLAVFAAAALVLAAIGLYGVIAYAVGQRTREFGIRVALGATKGDVLGLVLRRGLVLTGIGIAAGVAGSLALTGLLTRYLFEVKPTDPVTFVEVSLLLLAVALFASWLPARRAAKVDPMIALRCE
jgi:putative ABC transport system permease protein